MRRDVIVIGTSAGGIEALRALVKQLPAGFPASISVVMHTAPESPGVLDEILKRAGRLPAVIPKDRERMVPGHIYVAPPDHHLLLEPCILRVTKGPKENRFRPAVDPLFRSAAQTYGPRVIGVVLTGGLDDGTAGLWAIKRLGGIAVVQDPEDALVPSMPRNALSYVKVDYCVPLEEIAPLLVHLTSQRVVEEGEYKVPEEMDIEINIARDGHALESGILKLGEPSIFACPECHGVLLQLKEENRTRYRCHTGHAYSADSLLADISEKVGETLWSAVRALEEGALLMRHIADHLGGSQNGAIAETFIRKANDAQRRANTVRTAAIEHEELSRDTVLEAQE